MTVRRLLVVVTTLFVMVPLALTAAGSIVWMTSALHERTNDRLDRTLVAAERLLTARQDALAGDVRLAAQLPPGPATTGDRPLLDRLSADRLVADRLVHTGLVDEATATASDGTVVATTGGVDPARPVVLSASWPLVAGDVLSGRVGITAVGVSELATVAGVRLSVVAAPPVGSSAAYRRSVILPDGRWLVAATPRGPSDAAQQRWILTAVLIVLATSLVVVVLARAVLRRATRPLERLVHWADDFAPTGDSPSADDTGDGSLALAFRRVARDLRTRSEELHDTKAAFRLALERLGDTLASTHDLEGILEVMVETSLLIVPADAAVYYRITGLPATLQASHARGVSVEQLVLEGSGLAGYAALTGDTVIWPGPVLPDLKEPPAVAALAVPLTVLGRLVGVLGVYGTTVGRSFAADDISALQTVLRQSEVAMANVELHRQAQREALTDGLTGLWNRRHFDLRCRDAQLASSRFAEPFAVIIADVDDFKQINDQHDHFTGDAALVHLAAIMRRSSRDVDVVARWGGEEFAILVQRGGLAEAVVVAERICATLRDDPLVYDGTVVPFTVSCGVASHPQAGTTAAEVVAAADAALLRAKGAGKDRIERAGAPISPGGAPATVPARAGLLDLGR